MRENPEIRMYGLAKEKMTDAEIDAQEENRKRAERLSSGFAPGRVKTNEPVLVINDNHIPYDDRLLEQQMYKVADEYSVDIMMVVGDFWDCEGYKNESKYVSMTWFEAFVDEKMAVADRLARLVDNFKRLYFCRGNHELRWMKYNRGMVGIDELFATTRVAGKYHVTLDDHMVLEQKNTKWLLIHPDNYSPSQLSVPFSIADKVQCNVLCAHGHHLAKGYSRTGEYQIVDNGGMFDSDQIEYLRRTTKFPSVMSGFSLIMDGKAYQFAGKGMGRIV